MSEFVDSPSAASAAGTRVRALRDFFLGKGWDVQLIVPMEGIKSEESTLSNGGVLRLRTYETHRQQLQSPAAALLLPLTLGAYLAAFRTFQPDVVVISAYSPFLLVEPLLAARLRGVPVVYDVLDSWILLSAFHPGRIRNWLKRSIERFAFSCGNLVVGVTRTQLDLIQERYRLDPGKVALVPRGTDPPTSPPMDNPPDYDIIHVGPPRDYYDNEGMVDFLARLASLRPGFRVAFLGIGEGPEKNRLQKNLAQHGLGPKTDLIPPVPRSEVSRWTARSRAGLIALTKNPLYRAAISTKAYDYIVARIPILFLGPSDSEQAEFIMKLGIGRVCEGPAQLAVEANALLSDERALNEIRAHADIAASSLAWSEVLKPLYEKVVTLSRPVEQRGGAH